MMYSPSASSPSSRAPQACKRCSLNKKKCDRRVPRCSGCIAADVQCELAIKTGDKKLMRQIEESREETRRLQEQIVGLQLELQRRDGSPGETHVQLPSMGFQTTTTILPLPFLVSNNHPVLSHTTRHLTSLNYIFTSFGLQNVNFANDSDIHSLHAWTAAHRPPTESISDALPSMEEVRATIQSLVESSKHGPSNLDKIISLSQLGEDCRLVYGPNGLISSECAPSRFRCFITVYLAMCMTSAANGEEITTNSRAMACLSTGLRELGSVTAKEDLTCVEALTLLCELAIHAPSGLNLWHLLGLATRTAVALSLHRRDSVYLPTSWRSPLPDNRSPMALSEHNQRRKDLFWALYSLDRLASFVLNRPPSIAEAEIDVDLPPSTMWPEGKYATLSSEALWVHHIQARRLYGQIQMSLYTEAVSHDGDRDLRAHQLITEYMQQVQQWYMRSRFNSTVIPFSEESIKRHVLDDVQYHQMVMALNQPSFLLPNISTSSVATLHRSASLSVGLFHHSASRKQLNIHWVNLHQAFTSCAILIYCMRQHQLRTDLEDPSHETIKSVLTKCREVIALFKGLGHYVLQYENMLSELINAFETHESVAISPSVVSQVSPYPAPSASPGDQPSAPPLPFDIDMAFDPNPFPDMEGNILSPSYWMDTGQVQLNRSAESNESRDAGA